MRNSILDFINKELIGPDPVNPHVQDNGEEILINEPPRLRYSAGILFPKKASFNEVETISQDEEIKLQEENNDDIESNEDPVNIEKSKTNTNSENEYEDEVGLANSYLPSAMGFSCLVKIPSKGFIIKVKLGVYRYSDYSYKNKMGKDINSKAYYRTSLDQDIIIKSERIPKISGISNTFSLFSKNGDKIKAIIHIRNRTPELSLNNNGCKLLTFTLINTNESDTSLIRNEDCFFQASFSVQSEEKCFYPYEILPSIVDKEDEESNRLLFRNKKTFAVGHGCSPSWDDEANYLTNEICANIIPLYEVKPIIPNQLETVELKMYDLCDLSVENFKNLEKLNIEYEKWINKQEEVALKILNDEMLNTAKRHIKSCRECLKRMKEGVDLLKENKKVLRAFSLMNRAMLLQQLHYNIDTRNWKIENGLINGLENAVLPDINDNKTWKKGLGAWRPFQIAFILMNLNAMLDYKHVDRKIVDLIWFPTGGGKTEAYLGLSAYTIFLKRLKNNEDSGTTILMRYTLRLLTAQQFQRAASLICACEIIRNENVSELGDERISIGLWVGELTPNTRAIARTAYRDIERGTAEENPFVVLKCPWCGSQMGYIKNTKYQKIKGYKRRRINNIETIIYQCGNEQCEFSNDNFILPLMVIDEDIYDNPPTLLIGTVDKFAMLNWKPQARSLFGFRNDNRLSPPELIIQDELHLISGPLGSMVGLYETMIEEFCSIGENKPKIIASTATISRAKEQINSLYGRGKNNVSIFPAQCLNSGDSFFAYEDKSRVGRYYAGVFASAVPSHATAQVRHISALLQAVKSIPVKDEKQRDPYWTILTYFNSIRELGHAATLIRADMREYLNSMWIRKDISNEERRFINKDIELTSRISSNEIPEYLQQLSKSWKGEIKDYVVDICLATNMISVGVDIPRLGLMTVIGQPKTTSEYIQATSRVGRSKQGPGLVFTIYNCSKPRDRSHYEHFQEYHSRIYSNVEPTSVTPFSTPARERAIHAILIGLIRFYSDEQNRNKPRPFPKQEIINEIKNIIIKRVETINEDELYDTIKIVEEKLRYWENELPSVYGKPFGQITDLPLMYPAGSNPPDDIKCRAWSTPTSMRNVDSTCQAMIINNYYSVDEA